MLFADGAKPKQTLIATVHTKGKVHVEQYDVYGLLCHQFQDILWLGGGQHLLESAVQQILHCRQYSGIVIND
jgi:hypothetical protein